MSTNSNETNLEHCKCTKNKKPNKLTTLAKHLRRGRSLNFGKKRHRNKGQQQQQQQRPSTKDLSSNCTTSTEIPNSDINSATSPKWSVRFNCAKKDEATTCNACCVCTCYRRTDEHHLGAGVVFQNGPEAATNTETSNAQLLDSSGSDSSQIDDGNSASGIASDLYGTGGNGPAIEISCSLRTLSITSEDCDEQARLQRAREIAEGIKPPANFCPIRRLQLLYPTSEPEYTQSGTEIQAPRRLQIVCPPDVSVDSLKALFQTHVTLRSCPLDTITGCHTQVDYIHCLVPDLLAITNCSFYWGKMDRYEAERLLDGKPEGTFLLRDSAQEEFLFSVSFRKYGRSLHARIEQWNHKFSFDSHDPSVYASDTVCGLIEHYKDPSGCMFFEPMLTLPLHRNFAFPLEHLCRAAITSRLQYDNVNRLQLPKCLKSYLKEYHYRQKVRVERFDDDMQWIDLRRLH